MTKEEEYLGFSDDPLGASENRWIRAHIYKEGERRKQRQAWFTIPPAVLAILSAIGMAWGWMSGFFHKG